MTLSEDTYSTRPSHFSA